MASKDKNPKPEKDPAGTGIDPKKEAASAEKPEVVPPKEPLPPTLPSSSRPKKEKSSSGAWGIIFFLFLILAGGLGAGGYFLYQEQMKFQNETLAKLSQLDAQLSALDTEADQTRQNKESIDTVKQDLQQFRTEMDTTLKAHQSTLSTLDEDVMRLKEKIDKPADKPTEQTPIADQTPTEVEPLPGEVVPEILNEEPSEPIEPQEEDPDKKSQKFLEWMENFFAAIWNWLAGLFS